MPLTFSGGSPTHCACGASNNLSRFLFVSLRLLTGLSFIWLALERDVGQTCHNWGLSCGDVHDVSRSRLARGGLPSLLSPFRLPRLLLTFTPWKFTVPRHT
jgi:hypothetical protein